MCLAVPLALSMCLFTLCVVQVFLLQICLVSSPFGYMIAMRYWRSNLLWIISRVNETRLFSTWARRSTQFTSILASQLVVASEVSLEEAGVGFFMLLRQLRREVDLLELHYWAAAGKIRLRLVGAGLIPSSPYVYYLGCHLKARKATAHCSRNPDLLCAELLINS